MSRRPRSSCVEASSGRQKTDKRRDTKPAERISTQEYTEMTMQLPARIGMVGCGIISTRYIEVIGETAGARHRRLRRLDSVRCQG